MTRVKPKVGHPWSFERQSKAWLNPKPCPKCHGTNLLYVRKQGVAHVYCAGCDYKGPKADNLVDAYASHNAEAKDA